MIGRKIATETMRCGVPATPRDGVRVGVVHPSRACVEAHTASVECRRRGW